jgi:ribonuclease HI
MKLLLLLLCGHIHHLAQQVTRGPFEPWSDFPAMLSRDEMVHVVTDGGARQNPGNAGWGALIRQKGFCTYNFGHNDRATNTAMEIRAVVEALRVLPPGMHAWVSTDSAYVKNGITQWLPKWMRNNWKNSQGAPVANKSLWQKLYEEVGRQTLVEWSWVKAHNGTLLNECADIPVGEDTDSTEYSRLDREDTPLPNGRDDLLPGGYTFMMKDGDGYPLTQYLSDSEPV